MESNGFDISSSDNNVARKPKDESACSIIFLLQIAVWGMPRFSNTPKPHMFPKDGIERHLPAALDGSHLVK